MPRSETIRVPVKPTLLRWAQERARLDPDEMALRFPKLQEWEREATQPTLKQLEAFAHATHAPIGYFFLPEPPVENIPIPDFRTISDAQVRHPSPDLLDTLYICQQRQEWYRDFLQSQRETPLNFVGTADIRSDIIKIAEEMRQRLGLGVEQRRRCPTWLDALRQFVAKTDAAGILVMINGVVGSDNHRVLDPKEFRGFALADPIAPLVFVNGADSKSAQMFTLAHELAHLWLGQSALSTPDMSDTEPDNRNEHRTAVEHWCNRVAAELLVPLAVFRDVYPTAAEDPSASMNRLARHFKVSTLVILRRMFDAGGLSREAFWRLYHQELDRLAALPASDGGNFYLTLGARVSKRFARALVISTLEGQTLHRDAFRMLGFSKLSTFHELAKNLELA